MWFTKKFQAVVNYRSINQQQLTAAEYNSS